MHVRRRRRSRRLNTPRIFVLLVVGGIAVMTYLIFGPAIRLRYQRWQYQRTQAEKALTAPVIAPVSSLSASLRTNPGNPTAWLRATELLENTGDRAALAMRAEIIELQPTLPAPRLAFVHTALRFREIATAEAALEALPPELRATAEAKRLAAAAAFLAGRNADADELFAQAVADTPEAARVKLARQLFRLHYGNFSQATETRQELEVAVRRNAVGLEILRELIFDDLRRNEAPTALSRAESLVHAPGATFADRLLRAELVMTAQPLKFAELLPELAAAAAGDAGNATLFLGWLGNYGRLGEAAAWIEAQPEAIRRAPDVLAARAGLALAQDDSNAATRLLREGAWGAVDSQAVQLAMSARLLESRERPELRQEVWNRALTAAEKDLSGLQVLRRLARHWRWPHEYQTTLYHIARRYPAETWAHQLLAEEFLRQRQTNDLKATYALWHEAAPDDLRVEMRWHQLELLTTPSSTENRLTARVRELYETNRTSPLFATTYALACWQLGRNDDALAALEKIPSSERRAPSRAFYYALYLATARRMEEARTYLALSAEPPLLSEERTLLHRARSLAEMPAR